MRQVVTDRDWAEERRGNRGVSRLLVEAWDDPVSGARVTMKTEAWFDGYVPQSYVRSSVWTSEGWKVVLAAKAEDWQPVPGSNDMMNWPYWGREATADEWRETDRGLRADEAFDSVRSMAWVIVAPDAVGPAEELG